MPVTPKLKVPPFPRRRGLAMLAGLVLAAPILGAGGADAQGGRPQPEAAAELLIRPQQERARVPWQMYFTPSCPIDSHLCEGPVRDIPKGWRLEIRSVSCLIRMGGDTQDIWNFRLRVGNADGGFVQDFFGPTHSSRADRVFNTQTVLYANPGDSLSFWAEGAGYFDAIACKFAGDRVLLR